jgi:anti-anti-sigma factor
MSVHHDSRPEWLVPILFDAQVRLSGETVVVEVRGELCLATAQMLLKRLDELDRDFARLVLDLRPVTFIDSTGIRLLIQLQARARRSDGFDFAVCIEGAPVRTLELVGMRYQLERIAGEEIVLLLAEGACARDMTRN